MEAVVNEKLTEDERCMKIASSVLDEETVFDMVKTFLQFEEQSVPDFAQMGSTPST